MSHFAEVENGIVKRVIVVLDDYNGLSPEQWAKEKLGGEWIKCSYSGSIHKNYPGIGYTYDKNRDAFIAPKPHRSWV
jgi:hypothetical protein